MKSDKINLSSASLYTESSFQENKLLQDRYSLIRRLKAPIWIFDIDNSCIVFANKPAFLLWGAKDEEDLCARDLTEDMSPTVRRRLQQYQVDFIEHNSFFTEQWTLYPKGLPTSVMVVYSGVQLEDGRMGMFCEVCDQSEDEPENIRSAEALLHTDVMISQYSINGEILYMNPAARNAAVGSQHEFSDIFLNRGDYEHVMTAVHEKGENRLVTNVHTESGVRWYDISVKRCLDAVTGKPAILVTAIDVSELKVARDKARYLADRDQLTGCYNRSYIQQKFDDLTHAKSGKCALVYFDIDKFKKINDELGHEMGDIVLKQLSIRTRKIIRSEDQLARLGGDEFVILFHEVLSSDELAHKVNDLQRAFSEPIRNLATHVNVTVSVGVTVFEPHEIEFDTALRNADIALYISKQGGRDQVTYYNDEIGAIDKERRVIEADIKRGIEENEFVLYYQPRVDLRSGRTVSVEALVRWIHPKHGLIMPDKFIPICEETGMIEDLGEFVLKTGCHKALEWTQAGFNMGISINISPRQFQGKRLIDSLRDFASVPGFSCKKVELEITENVLFGDHQKIAEKLHEIVDMGYQVAIDDFGTGYSNLSYISRFPLNCIKIDKSFVRQLPESGPIIQLILTLARQVGATSVAEGVETQAEYDWLLSEGCDQVQGYFFSRPVPCSELQASLEQSLM